MKSSPSERYALADRIQHASTEDTIRNATILPHWIAGTDTFWCERWVDGTKQTVLVDAPAGTITPTTANELNVTGQGTPRDPSTAVNAQGTHAAFVRDDNIWVREIATGDERALTTDGRPDWTYGVDSTTTGTRLAYAKHGLPVQVRAAWSPDGTRLLTHRLDERAVARTALLESTPSFGAAPVAHEYPYAFPGATHLPTYHLVVLDLDGARLDLRHVGLPATRMAFSPLVTHCAWWSADGTRIYYVDAERGEKRVTVNVADSANGDVRVLFTETSDTYVDVGWDVYGPLSARYLANSEQLLWMSERSGWMHLYRYDLHSGQLLNTVTTGEFALRDLLVVDEDSQTVVFIANGREEGWDPCDKAVYSVSFDGTRLTLLTPEPADHDVLIRNHVVDMVLHMGKPGLDLDDVSALSPSGRFLVASATRSGEPPVHSLFAVDGKKVVDLATVELADGITLRWPERFTTTAADGTTQIFGQLFLPAALEDDETLPILDHVYLGPQTAVAAITNITNPFGSAFFTLSAAYAALGFAVTVIDGRGLPFRSKAFHDHSYGAIQRTSELADHVTALEQLRAGHPALGDRVGVVGASGGGFGAATAILTHPDTYSVAVAQCGNHDQRLFSFCWGERYMGLPVDERWEQSSPATHAANLRGSLLLIHGELDQGVHPANSQQLADALLKAGKDFELLLVPGADHGVGGVGVAAKRTWDHLVRHLRQEQPPTDAKVRGAVEVMAALLAPLGLIWAHAFPSAHAPRRGSQTALAHPARNRSAVLRASDRQSRAGSRSGG